MPETRRLFTFVLAGSTFGLDVHLVGEVLDGPAVTRVPGAPTGIAGLVNVRGDVVTVFDMESLFRIDRTDPMAADSPVEKQLHVIVDLGRERVSVPVEAVGDVCEVENELLQDCPDSVAPEIRSRVSGTTFVDGELVLLLDAGATFDPDGASASGSVRSETVTG